ncbi:polysaccharide lyase-domain-containing protein [Mycena epipterygia]|nr:polysaccharide lyase-domain-containing protein [Mycena epipterygia]
MQLRSFSTASWPPSPPGSSHLRHFVTSRRWRGLLSASASVTQTFANRGTIPAGWDETQVEHEGTISQVTNVVYGTNGGTAIKATQTYDPDYTGRYHSEAHHFQGYQRGDEGFYGFAFRLQEDWQFSPAQSYNLAQFIADFSDTGCDDFMPSSMVWIVSNQLASRVKTNTVCAQVITDFINLATVSAGTWHKVEIQANWQNEGTGYYKLWFDGVKVLEEFNIDTTIDDTREFSPFRQVWYDQIGIGSVFADADPDQWS